MSQAQLKEAIQYLEGVIKHGPTLTTHFAQMVSIGGCYFCAADVQSDEPHESNCHYEEGKRLLKKFKELLVEAGNDQI